MSDIYFKYEKVEAIEDKILVRVNGNIQRMSTKEYERLAKDTKYSVYEKIGLRCLDLKLVVISPPIISNIAPMPSVVEPVKEIEQLKDDVLKASTQHAIYDRRGCPTGRHYHYKAGKQTSLLEWSEIKQKLEAAYLDLEHKVYFVLTMYLGTRRQELLQTTVNDLTFDNEKMYVNILREKNSEQTEPVPIDLTMDYMKDIIAYHKQRSELKPTKKVIVRYKRVHPDGDKKAFTVSTSRIEKIDRWMFSISSGTALRIFKKTLGNNFYTHYGRLWSLSTIGSSPEGSIVMLKSRSGIKSVAVLGQYMGQSRKQLNKSSDILKNITATPDIATETKI